MFEEHIQNFDYSSASTPELLEWLTNHQVSLAISSYSCQRLIVIRQWQQKIDTFLLPVADPKGFAVAPGRVSIAAHSELIEYFQRDDLKPTAIKYLEKTVEDCDEPARRSALEIELTQLVDADALFLPRNRHITGRLNIHDMAWCKNELWFVNSRYGCLCTFHPERSFEPHWHPYHMKKIFDGNNGHLNGMATDGVQPHFVTCFGTSQDDNDWKENLRHQTGKIIDVKTNKVLLEGLSMPHSPRLHNNKLYFCHSARAQVESISLLSGNRQVELKLPGFTRALTFYRHYMLVCTSKIRNEEMMRNIDLDESWAGMFVYDLENENVVAYTRFTGDVAQIYDVAVLENMVCPHFVSLHEPMAIDVFDYQEK